MKRLGSTESLGGFVSVSPSTDGKRSGTDSNGLIYSRGFQTMLDSLDEEDCTEECGHVAEKKRRLSVEQVKALEKNFEVENKLEPERKLKLAQELGLQPRQVAVWFQNRRARWKTKQLERDYGVLKSKFDALKLNFDAIQREKEALLSELTELKSQLGEENADSKVSVTEEILTRASQNEVLEQSNFSASAATAAFGGSETTNPTTKDCYNSNDEIVGITVYGDLKDGSSDSDSSAILNEENAAISSSAGVLQHQQQQQRQILMSPPSSSSIRLKCSSSPSSINCFQISDSNEISGNAQKTYYNQHHHHHQQQYVKMEEQNFLGTEEPCSFFSDDQPPSLHWYCDQWD